MKRDEFTKRLIGRTIVSVEMRWDDAILRRDPDLDTEIRSLAFDDGSRLQLEPYLSWDEDAGVECSLVGAKS